MNNKFEKNLHIICELMTFLHIYGATDYKAELLAVEGGYRFIISAEAPNVRPEKIEELAQALKLPRQHEVEQEYWGIFGETGESVELTLIGIMIDSAEVEYKNGVVTINATRLD